MFRQQFKIIVLAVFAVTATNLHAAGTETANNTLLGSGAGANLNDTNGVDNTFIGVNAGNAVTTGDNNTFVGDNAGQVNTASFNTFIGESAGPLNTTGASNTFIGQDAGLNNTTGNSNTLIGQDAGLSNTIGNSNTFVGEDAGAFNTTGNSNTFIGENAGLSNATGSGNVFLGKTAGENETTSNKLYIENSNSAAPLLYGEFDNNIVGINGTLGVGTQMPDSTVHVRRADGTAQVLVQEANATPAQRTLFKLQNAGNTRFAIENTNAAVEWLFLNSAGGTFRISDVENPNTVEFELDQSGNLTTAGTVNGVSDRNAKTNFAELDAGEVLEKVIALPITEWAYKTDQDTKHIGPVAQDFRAAFGLGKDDKTIALNDLSGVALAAIQGLKVQKDREIEALRKEKDSARILINALKNENEALAVRVAALEKWLLGQAGQSSR